MRASEEINVVVSECSNRVLKKDSALCGGRVTLFGGVFVFDESFRGSSGGGSGCTVGRREICGINSGKRSEGGLA